MENLELNENYSFILAFTATCWKRIWYSMFLYCEHRKINYSNSIILKCLKYDLLSPTGIFAEIEPFLTKALKNGFLMPNEFKNNINAKRAILLFNETYEISKIKNLEEKRKAEIKFIHSHASSVFTDNEKEKEFECILKNIPDFKKKEDKHCSFCELIEIWDIELCIYSTKNIYQELILYSILQILNQN